MVKAYLRYEPCSAFGVIASAVPPVYDAAGKHIIAAALESVAVWNIKQGAKVGKQGLQQPPSRRRSARTALRAPRQLAHAQTCQLTH